MALTVGVNSWVDVDDANAYLIDIPGASDWFALRVEPAEGRYEESRSSFLVLAFRVLSNHAMLASIPADSTDSNIIQAQIEMALFLLKYKDEYFKREALIASGVKNFTMGRWTETLGEVTLPSNVLSLLKSYSSFGSRIVHLIGEDYLD